MESFQAMEDRVVFFGTLIIEACVVLKLIILLTSRRLRCSLRSAVLVTCSSWWNQLKKWWETKYSDDEEELDQMRCKWLRIMWTVVLVICLLRLIRWQLTFVRGRDDLLLREFDVHFLMGGTFGLIIAAGPGCLTGSSLDFWYVVIMVSLDVLHLITQRVDVRDWLGFTMAGRFLFAALAKRTSCVLFCTLSDLLTAMYLSQSQSRCGEAYPLASLPVTYSVFLVCILGVRRLLRENVLLKVDVKKRTVELGAVSSLLTVCYDAVVELDHDFKLTHDSNQLSSMLLHHQAGGLSGRPLLDLFAENDRPRISEQFLNSSPMSVVALNADMLDADFNNVKVELFCAQFKNLANEQCFLIAVREIQDLAPDATIQAVSPASPVSVPEQQMVASSEDFQVVYDIFSFEVWTLDRKLEQLCQAHLGVTLPESILELASHEGRLSLSNQLQWLGNQVDLSQPKPTESFTVTFNMLGLGKATATVSIEYDQLLDCWMGSMVIPLASVPAGLTTSQLQTLPQGLGQSFGRLRRRSRSQLSRRSGRWSGSSESGAISELRRAGKNKVPL